MRPLGRVARTGRDMGLSPVTLLLIRLRLTGTRSQDYISCCYVGM